MREHLKMASNLELTYHCNLSIGLVATYWCCIHPTDRQQPTLTRSGSKVQIFRFSGITTQDMHRLYLNIALHKLLWKLNDPITDCFFSPGQSEQCLNVNQRIEHQPSNHAIKNSSKVIPFMPKHALKMSQKLITQKMVSKSFKFTQDYLHNNTTPQSTIWFIAIQIMGQFSMGRNIK